MFSILCRETSYPNYINNLWTKICLIIHICTLIHMLQSRRGLSCKVHGSRRLDQGVPLEAWGPCSGLQGERLTAPLLHSYIGPRRCRASRPFHSHGPETQTIKFRIWCRWGELPLDSTDEEAAIEEAVSFALSNGKFVVLMDEDMMDEDRNDILHIPRAPQTHMIDALLFGDISPEIGLVARN